MADKLVIDCSKPEGHPDRVKELPFTAEERQQRTKDLQAFEASERGRAQAAERRNQAAARVKQRAATDPDFAALATLMGLEG